jgi:hypothetical protein
VLLVFGAPCQLPLLAGPEHGRTIPLVDIDGSRSREQERKAFLLGLLRVSAEKQNEYEGQQERHGHERGNIVCR